MVAYALAGTMKIDLTKDPLGEDRQGNPVYLRDIWPSNKEVADLVRKSVTRAMFKTRYSDVFKGDSHWRKIKTTTGLTYAWNKSSTYVQHPPYFETAGKTDTGNIENARILGLFADSITTDHISPAGAIQKDGPAGKYLTGPQSQTGRF